MPAMRKGVAACLVDYRPTPSERASELCGERARARNGHGVKAGVPSMLPGPDVVAIYKLTCFVDDNPLVEMKKQDNGRSKKKE